MPLDPYSSNLESENAPEKNPPLELIAARKDVIETAKRNLSRTTGSALEKQYVTKAHEYAEKFGILPELIEDWIREGRTVFESEEALAKWADSLPLPPQFQMH